MKAGLKITSLFLLATLLLFNSCKKQFDEPPINELPNLTANTTIAQLVALAATTPVALSNQIIEGTVIADDQSGNFYKQLVIQDSTGGIRIDIDAYSIYTDFPIGRKVWVKCQGLYIWKDGDVPALIGSSNTNTSRIPESTYRQYIIGGEYNQPLTPKVKTLSALTPADYHTLIQLNNVEFADCYAGSSYAYPTTQESKNAELTECSSGGMVIVRNSGFADFAGQLMPTNNGSIVAVFNSFGGTAQLFIRNPSDVSTMTGTRCTPLSNYADVSITDLRAQFTGAATSATGKIRGIVISDPNTGQWQTRNAVIQEPGGSGITVRFDDDHSFGLNDYVEVKVGGGTLSQFNGLLQVADLPLCRATVLPNPTNISITPRVATVADILANANTWESTLVKVMAANLTGGTTYGDFGVRLNDATGNIGMFSGFATFASDPLPTGTGDVTAVVGDYNGIQLNIRNLSDVNISGGGSGGTLNQISIQAARSLFTGTAVNAPDTTKIVGIVISDRTGGNWVSQNMVIQEPSGSGIVIRFAANHSFNLGDEVQVNISNMSISQFNGLLQIGGVPLANATVLSSGNSITPRVATVQDILTNAEPWESTLVKVNNSTLSGGATYGDFGIMLNDATASISMFSAFANFASTPIPGGSGSVTGVVGDYNGVQINIRNTTDVNYTGGTGPNFITIAAARALFTGTTTTAPTNTSISGIIISDRTPANITGRNAVIQQTNGSGIVVRFAANHSLNLGDSVTINISGANISEFNGLLQIEPTVNAVVVSTGNTITPRNATIQNILANAEAWESTLVKITGATIASGTYSGTKVITDASGSMDMFTRTAATFSGTTVPSGTVNITAIVSQFDNTAPYTGGYQVNIRNTSDVQ